MPLSPLSNKQFQDVSTSPSDGNPEVPVGIPIEIVIISAQQADVQLHDAPNTAFSFSLPTQSSTDQIGGMIAWSATQADGTPLPAWLSFDPSNGTFSGVMPSWAITQGIIVTATTPDEGNASETFNIINSAPAANPVDTSPNEVIQNHIISPDDNPNSSLDDISRSSWSWSYNGLFTDPSGGSISSYSFTNPDGTPLSLITVDPSTMTLSGNLAEIAVKTAIRVTATTTEGATASGTIYVAFGDATPTIGKTQSDIIVSPGSQISFTLPTRMFNDTLHGKVDSYSVLQADGTALPPWISFNSLDNTFSGLAPVNAVNLQVQVTATTKGFSNSETFMVEVTGPRPVLSTPEPDQIFHTAGSVISFTLPMNSFTDPINGGPLLLTASGAAGSNLPTWLTFDPITGTFTGTAPAIGIVQKVVVTATNANGSTSEAFKVENPDSAPIDKMVGLANQCGTSGGWELDAPVLISDSSGGTVTTTFSRLDGSALPSSMFMDSETIASSSSPPGDYTIDILLTSTSSRGGISTNIVSLVFGTGGGATKGIPILQTQTNDQRVMTGQAVSFSLPTNSFQDSNNGSMTYTATQTDGTALPSWLTFNALTNTFTGTAPSLAGTIDVRVEATSSTGTRGEEAFKVISTTPPPSAPPLDAVPNEVIQNHVGESGNMLQMDGPTYNNWSWNYSGLFTDPNGGVISNYSFSNLDGTALSEVNIDPTAMTISGTDTLEASRTAILVTALTSEGTSATGTVYLQFGDATPTMGVQENDVVTGLGSQISFALAPHLFNDVLGGAAVTYTVVQEDGSALPSWLSFDSITNTFSGTAPTTSVNEQVKVIANTKGFSSSQSFMIEASGPKPILEASETDQVEPAFGNAFSFTLPANTFTDPTNSGTLTLTALGLGGSSLPSWLTFDPVTGTFSGTAPSSGTVQEVVITGTNANGSTSESFKVESPGTAPIDAAPGNIDTITIPPFFSAPLNSWMTDPMGGTVTSTFTRMDGTPLPSWMFTDGGTLSSNSIPGGDYTIEVLITSTTSHGGVGTNTETLVFGNGGGSTKGAPLLQTQTQDQRVLTGQALSFSLPASSFQDSNNGTMTYTATQADGTALPSWLTFNASTNTFSGTAPSSQGTERIRVTATSSTGMRGEESFNIISTPLSVINSRPSLAAPEQDQVEATAGNAFSFVLPQNSFSDPTNSGTLSITVSGLDGSSLPTWMTFDPVTKTFSGTAPTAGTMQEVVVTATNADGSSSEAFKVETAGLAPTDSSPGQLLGIGSYSFGAPVGDWFSDPLGGTVTSTFTRMDGSALPSWLSTDGGVLSSSTFPAGSYTFDILVTSRTSHGGVGTNTLKLSFSGGGVAEGDPILQNQASDQRVLTGQSLSFSLPPSSFQDSNNGTMTYTANQADGTALPSWLSFNASTNTFSGTAPSVAGTLDVRVTATSSTGTRGEEAFRIINSSPPPVDTAANEILLERVEVNNNQVLGSWSWNYNGLFTDPSGGSISNYSFANLDGTALSGVTIDPAAMTLSGSNSLAYSKTPIRVTVSTSEGSSAAGTIYLQYGDITPSMGVQENDVATDFGSQISFSLAPGLFNVAVGGDTITYSIVQEDGSALPSWLTFDSSTNTFSGTAPTTAVNEQVKIIASDRGFSSAQSFMVEVSGPKPILANSENDQVESIAGSAFTFTLPSNSFSDPTNGTLSLSASGLGGSSLPTWLTFDPISGTFFGTAPTAGTIQEVVVTATNANGSARETFKVETPAPKPTLAIQENDQIEQSSAIFSFSVPLSSFTDPTNSGTLALTASGLGGTSLPSWLTFDPLTGTFSGTAPRSPTVQGVVVTATSANGSTSEAFKVETEAPPPGMYFLPAPEGGDGPTLLTDMQREARDPLGGTITSTFTLIDGTALPSLFSVADGDLEVGRTFGNYTLDLLVTCTTSEGGIATLPHTFVFGDGGGLTKGAPVLEAQAPDQRVVTGQSLSFVLPENSFRDTVANNSDYIRQNMETITYKATQADGTALPSWLTFDGSTNTFSGTAPSVAGTETIRVTAFSSFGTRGEEAFNIITSAQPVSPGSATSASINLHSLGIEVSATAGSGGMAADAVKLLTSQAATATATYGEKTAQTTAIVGQGSPFALVLATNSFTDTVGSTSFAYTATMGDGSALPAWLTVSPTGTINGMAPSSQHADYLLNLTAIGNHGSVGHEQYTISATHFA